MLARHWRGAPRVRPTGRRRGTDAGQHDAADAARDGRLIVGRRGEVTNGTPRRLTSHPANDWFPVWSPDGAQLAFASDRNGASTIYRKATNGSGSEELVPTANVNGSSGLAVRTM